MIRLLCLAALAACGCAHNKANQYAYAPPLAPPVYSQPQAVAQPVAGVGIAPLVGPAPMMPPAGYPPPGMPATPAAPGMPMMPSAGVVPAMSDGSCPPCGPGSGGLAVPVVYEGEMQTTPCQ